MNRFLILLLLISLYGISCQKLKNSTFQKPNGKIWLGLGVFKSRQFKVSNRAYEIQQKIQDEINRIKEEILGKEEEARRKIYNRYLMPYGLGSSVLRDFHTNRF